MRAHLLASAGIATAMALSACGSDEAGNPPPSPVVTASPTPTPSPSPSPAPSASPGSSIALLGGAKVGDALTAVLACSNSVEVGFDALGRVNAIGTTPGVIEVITPSTVSAVFRVPSVDTFVWDINGFGGYTYGAGNRAEGDTYVRIFAPNLGEMQIARNNNQIEFSTYGMLAEDYGTTPHKDGLCFYAAAPSPTSAFPGFGQVGYFGEIDGYRRAASGEDWRLVGPTNGSDAFLDHKGGLDYELLLNVSGVTDPLLDPSGQTAQDFGSIRIPLKLNSTEFGPYEGNIGSSQVRAYGRLWGSGYIAALVAFSITESDGTVTFGVAAMDGAQI